MNLEKQTLPAMVGEWSLAITDCQKYLHNGYANPCVAPDANSDADQNLPQIKSYFSFLVENEFRKANSARNGWRMEPCNYGLSKIPS